MYMRVARWKKGVYGRATLCTGEQRCAQEGSVIAHRRVAGCAQEGSVAMAGCHSLLN